MTCPLDGLEHVREELSAVHQQLKAVAGAPGEKVFATDLSGHAVFASSGLRENLTTRSRPWAREGLINSVFVMPAKAGIQ
jgi:hypothetical protein